jgi:hypothetical protein
MQYKETSTCQWRFHHACDAKFNSVKPNSIRTMSIYSVSIFTNIVHFYNYIFGFYILRNSRKSDDISYWMNQDLRGLAIILWQKNTESEPFIKIWFRNTVPLVVDDNYLYGFIYLLNILRWYSNKDNKIIIYYRNCKWNVVFIIMFLDVSVKEFFQN